MLYQAHSATNGRPLRAPMYNIHRADLIQLLYDAVPTEAKRMAPLRRRVPGQDGVE